MNQQARVNVPIQDTTVTQTDIGRRPVAAADSSAAVQPAAHGPIRWGPVWAGIFTAITSFVVIELFLYWIGALVIKTHTGYLTQGVGNAWISAVVAIVTFFLGGWAAGSSKVLRGTGAGLLTGYLVWALAMTLIIALSANGMGPVFGAAGYAFNNMVVAAHQVGAGSSPGAFVGVVRDGAGWAFLFMVLSAIASAFGGWLGNHDRPAGVATTV